MPMVEALVPGLEPRVTGRPVALVEQTDYPVLVQSRAGHPVAVVHRDPLITARLLASDDGQVVHGTVNFGAQVGHSRFVVTVDGRPHLALTVEVYPTKLDYRQDYEALRAEVQALAQELAYAYLRATYRPTGWGADRPGPVAWLTALRGLLGDLDRALAEVVRHPRWETVRDRADVRPERLRRPGAVTHRMLARAGVQTPGGTRRLPDLRATPTLDTPEHRWLAGQLRDLRRRLARLVQEPWQRPSTLRNRRTVEELTAMQERLTQWLAMPPFREAGPSPSEPTIALLTAPGYREAVRVCHALRQGLALHGGPLELGLKDLHLLYEYWCYLTVVRLTAELTGQPLPVERLVRVRRDGLHLRLQRGRAQAVAFSLADGRQVELTYNPRFSGPGYLTPQQPDIVLTVRAPGGRLLRFVLDAKYRLDASAGYVRRFGVPGPPVAALNALHRYRDAIREDDGGERSVVQAVALYPYRPEDPARYARSRAARALAEVGVGALPLLPGYTTALRDWLAGCLAVPPVRAGG